MYRFDSRVLTRWPAVLLPVLLTLACEPGVNPSGYTIKWMFVNNSGTTAVFTGIDGDNTYSRTVSAHDQIGPHESTGLLPGKQMDVTSTVTAGAVNRTETRSVPVSGGGITTVTIRWDGTTMDVSAFIQCS